MEYRAPGRSGLRISVLTMGTMTFGGRGGFASVGSTATLVLSDDERTQLDQVSAPPLIYPFRHQAKTARDRLSPADLTLLGPHLQ